MSLEVLLQQLKRGEITALDEIYSLTYEAVYVSALLIVKNRSDAEDIMQDTYLKVCEKIGFYKEQGYGKAWICTIARNMALDKFRKNKRLVNLDGVENSQLCAINNHIEDGGIIEFAEKVLSCEEFEIVIAHIKAGLSHKETAKLLGKNYASVRWIYYNALKKLKKLLVDKGNVYEI